MEKLAGYAMEVSVGEASMLRGEPGKSAYAYAVEGGYTGTEEEFAEKMAAEIPTVDSTLTQPGQAADAKAVGDKIAEITGISLVEPAEDDIPKVFFGGALQQNKTEKVVPFRYISKTDDISGYAEIKAQGNSSMTYPKKNQTVKLFKDADCTKKLKVDFKGWGAQNKHVYKANWIDLSHARNVVSARLWADIVKSRANYAELPELLRTSPNQGAVDGFPVKVYAAGVYQGRYTLNIPKDKWAFNMDDTLDNHCVLCGENYASGCFRAAANINGDDWSDEIHDVVPESIKTRWNEVISFVMNSTDDEFKMNLGQYFDIQSLIDYHLFGLQSCGLDAYGKNQIYMTYDGQKWIASMYDMDSTWGLWWNGSKFVATDYDRSEYQDFKDGNGNLLYIRLEQLFYEELQARWTELKNGALSIENIINRFERFTDIATSELVKEDYASTTGGGAFTGIPSKTTNNIQQIRSYVLARHTWTDEYVAALTPAEEVHCTGITLSASELTFTAEGTQTLVATVTPDNCTDVVVWESSNASVATVNNGVVTAKGNGNATITANCGNYSASCNVTVNVIVTKYSITRNLVGCTSNSVATEVVEGASHSETITANNGYTLSGGTIAVTMGGIDITELFADGILSIESVTGNIVISVSAVEAEVDYSLNPISTVELHNGYTYTNGVLTASAGEHCTGKFSLQNCPYRVYASAGTYAGVFVWDKDGNYVKTINATGSGIDLGYIFPDLSCEYAIKVYDANNQVDASTFNFIPVDNRETAVDSLTLQLSDYSFAVSNLSSEAEITDDLAKIGITDMETAASKIASTNYLTLISDGGSVINNGADNANPLSFHLLYYGEKFYLKVAGFTTVGEADAYFAENNTVFTLNGRVNIPQSE